MATDHHVGMALSSLIVVDRQADAHKSRITEIHAQTTVQEWWAKNIAQVRFPLKSSETACTIVMPKEVPGFRKKLRIDLYAITTATTKTTTS